MYVPSAGMALSNTVRQSSRGWWTGRLLMVLVMLFTLVGVAPATSKPASAATNFLKASGTVLKNNSGTGSIVDLRGTNLGGWLLQEQWMSPGATDQYTGYRTLNNRFGATTTTNLFNGYEDTWIQASDLDKIKSLGLNVVRVPIYWEILMNTDGTMKADSQAFRALDWLVTQSTQRGLYVILDLHGTPGGDDPWQSGGIINSNQLWSNSTYQNWTVQIWQRLATHYKGNATIAGYDLLNEPLLTSGAADNSAQVQQKFDFYNRLYQAVRAIDADHLIIVEAFFSWAQALPPTTYGWTNVMYQLHPYDMDDVNANNYNAVSSFVDSQTASIASYQSSWNVPVYTGEFWFGGYYDLATKFLNNMNAMNVSWTTWTYKVTSGADWGLYVNSSAPAPDFNNDSSATIASKWSQFGTSSFQADTGLQNAVSAAAHAPVSSLVTIKAKANGDFVSADNYGNNPLIANRTTAQGWEQYHVVTNSNGTVSFLSNANGKYVTADLNNGNKLIARATTIQQWEQFKEYVQADGTIGLQAMANNQYVTTDLNNGPNLFASRAAIGGAWEVYNITPIN